MRDRALSTDAARDRVNKIRGHVEDVKHLLVEAWEARDWETLGYSTWEDYCRAEFGASIAIPKSEREELVFHLRDHGMSLRAIESATGISKNTVARQLEAGVPSGTGDEPPKVKGTDGKSYTSKPKITKRTTEPRPSPDGMTGEALLALGDMKSREQISEEEFAAVIADNDPSLSGLADRRALRAVLTDKICRMVEPDPAVVTELERTPIPPEDVLVSAVFASVPRDIFEAVLSVCRARGDMSHESMLMGIATFLETKKAAQHEYRVSWYWEGRKTPQRVAFKTLSGAKKKAAETKDKPFAHSTVIERREVGPWEAV